MSLEKDEGNRPLPQGSSAPRIRSLTVGTLHPGSVDISIASPAVAASEKLVGRLTSIINAAYAFEAGAFWSQDEWTRTNPDEVRSIVRAGNWPLPGNPNLRRRGSLRISSAAVYITMVDAKTGDFGMLVCDPEHQGVGIGRILLRYADAGRLNLSGILASAQIARAIVIIHAAEGKSAGSLCARFEVFPGTGFPARAISRTSRRPRRVPRLDQAASGAVGAGVGDAVAWQPWKIPSSRSPGPPALPRDGDAGADRAPLKRRPGLPFIFSQNDGPANLAKAVGPRSERNRRFSTNDVCGVDTAPKC